MIEALLADLICLSQRLHLESDYVERFKYQKNKNYDLVFGSDYSLKQAADMLDKVLARYLVQQAELKLFELHRPLQEAITREVVGAKSRQEGL